MVAVVVLVAVAVVVKGRWRLRWCCGWRSFIERSVRQSEGAITITVAISPASLLPQLHTCLTVLTPQPLLKSPRSCPSFFDVKSATCWQSFRRK